MLRILILVLFPLGLSPAALSSEVTSYAKVSRNGKLARSSHDSFSWIAGTVMGNNTGSDNGDTRSIGDIAITVSPVYMSPKNPKLKKGEAVDYPGASRYSTLDHETIAKLDATRKQKIQHRFLPPAYFDHDDAPAKGPPKGTNGASNSESSADANSSTFLGPIYPGLYDYSPPEFLDDKPTSKPATSVEMYPSMNMDDKMPGPYMSPPSTHNAGDQQQHETDYPDFDVPPMHGNDGSAMAGRPFPFTGDSYEHDHHGPHDVIYELPEYGYHHHHHHHPTTTEEPEMNDQRLDKRPYSYYFIGKKLWYVPLYFSIYFIIYIAALVLKSIARHKINFPAQLADVAANSKRSEPDESWRSVAERMLGAAERFAENTSGEGGSY